MPLLYMEEEVDWVRFFQNLYGLFHNTSGVSRGFQKQQLDS